jgi:dihydropteroate synthase
MKFNRPLVMGVLNVTPDSFSDGGEFSAEDDALNHARLLIAAGSNIIDVGGESTRPGAERVSIEEEQRRVISVITRIAKEPSFIASGARISIDTMNSQTAKAAVEAGASIINDVSGGLADKEMFSVAAESGAILVISHWRGFSDRMDTLNEYQDIARDVASELSVQVEAAVAAGVPRENIVIDPGLGFAKDMQQNWKLVARLDELEKLGLPILVGASRKRFIAGMLEPDKLGEVSNSRRDLATAVLTALLLQRKLWGIRVHNVLATTDAIDVVAALRNAETE